jgi:hypothetical protein
MGYTTYFEGQFDLNKPLTEQQRNYLELFNQTRRMKRNESKLQQMIDNDDAGNTHTTVGLPVGVDGEYYVDAGGFMGQDDTDDIVNYNTSPDTQPSLWCQWTPNGDGTAIEWDGGEKFHNYIEWIEYIIGNFIEPWGLKLNGEVKWQGEDQTDLGIISITDNQVEVKEGKVTITYE